tara:strand:+ start:1647 stop:2537 length:891 start_codon:yes stop_codon:yes gene_type:complete
MREKLRSVYYKSYKKLFYLPLILVILALAVLVFNWNTTGDFIDKDVSLTGGTTATIYTTDLFPDLEDSLTELFPNSDFFVRTLDEFGSDDQVGIVVEVADVDALDLEAALESILGFELNENNFSVEFVGSSLGESFYRQMLLAILLSFLFMALVVFITFRMAVPSAVVVFAAFADMVCTIAVLSLFNVKLSTAGIAAILLLIGYSIDTDILLTTKILKRKEGSIFDRLYSSMQTGLTMTATTVVALSVAYVASTSLVLQQMFMIIIIGLFFDVIMTYSMNAGVLVWYAKRRRRAGE